MELGSVKPKISDKQRSLIINIVEVLDHVKIPNFNDYDACVKFIDANIEDFISQARTKSKLESA